MSSSRTPGRIAATVCLILLPVAFFFRPLFLGRAFLPADLLGYIAPWKAAMQPSPPAPPPAAWNVLRYDGITQYYPWRLQAARSYREGRIPLWNPYQFAARGGTPLLADSQSAPLYPPNLLFWLTPLDRFWYAFGLSAALHLLWAGWGLYRLLRACGAERLPSLLSAVTFALSAPIVTWLSLPTFLAVASWYPWLLLLLKRAHDAAGTPSGRRSALGAGAAAGAMLLAGHLQMAFYGLLAGALYLLWRGHRYVFSVPPPERGRRRGRWIVAVLAGMALAVSLALPQVLPALSLSRISHRATGAPPSWTEYGIYVGNALPVRQMVTLLAPGFYGDPNAGTYWQNSDRPGGNNYAEWALYIGITPLLLAAFALALPWKKPTGVPSERVFFALLAAAALLLALGTPLNAPLFFLVPGYSQTGNPARCLVLLALALSALAGIGLDALLKDALPRETKRRAAFIGVVAPVLLAAIGASQGARYAAAYVPQAPFSQLLTLAAPDLLRGGVLLVLGAGALAAVPRLSGDRRMLGGVVLALLAAVDLFTWGMDYNPTADPAQVYPVTPGIAFLQQQGRRAARIAVLNRGWTLGAAAPRGATLPPNALTVYALHDIGGYDSLFPGEAKRQVKDAGGEDPSPAANGNMVFVKSVPAAAVLGARFVVVSPDVPAGALAGLDRLRRVYDGPDLRIYENPAGQDAPPAPDEPFAPFRVGLFCGLCALAALAAAIMSGKRPPMP